MSAITETCACGATFTASDRIAVSVRYAADDWRKNHKHAESVGICGDSPKMTGPEGFRRPFCVLKAGHAGMHDDGEGSSWGRIEQRPPRKRIPLAGRRA